MSSHDANCRCINCRLRCGHSGVCRCVWCTHGQFQEPVLWQNRDREAMWNEADVLLAHGMGVELGDNMGRHQQCGIHSCVEGMVGTTECPSCASLRARDTATGVVNVADLVDPDDTQGRTYRQINAEFRHNIPVGALVEIICDHDDAGARLFVVYQGRDCDQTPLYWLSPQRGDLPTGREDTDFWARIDHKWTGGWSEETLKVIRL